MQKLREQPRVPAQDFLPLNGTDYVEFYVGNARQAAYYYRAAFGMQLVAYRGPETGTRDRASYVLQQNKIRFVLTTPLQPDDPIAEHIRLHGDGVRDIALWVDDAESAYRETTAARGAQACASLRRCATSTAKCASPPSRPTATPSTPSSSGAITAASFLPGYRRGGQAEIAVARPVGLKYIDHMVGNVGWGEMNRWVDFYHDVMGFRLYQHFDDKDISTEYSALMSKVMSNGNDRVKFPINEPAEGKRKSQIEEYLEFYNGPGVQHIAMATDDIIETVCASCAARAWSFCACRALITRISRSASARSTSRSSELDELGILVDRDDEGYMLQIFTRPVEDRPTLFYEVIQRKGSRSFGKGNFKALFEAIEREQASRGNL